jgi:hypothetical protein
LEVIEALLRRPLASILAENLVDVTGLDDAEGGDGRERVTLRAAQFVGALARAHNLTLGPAGQVQVTRERAAVVVSLADAFAATLRSPVALLRIVTVAMLVMPRVVSDPSSVPVDR